MTAALLSAEGLSFGWPGRPLFQRWSHAFGPGLTWVQGGNGSGKTTLLKLLAGALAPAAGVLHCQGIAAHEAPLDYRRQVFWSGAEPIAFGHLKPAEYFDFIAGLYPTLQPQALPAWVEALGLTPFLGRRIDQLSTGSGRKTGLAAALAVGTPVLLLDEPLAALDMRSARVVSQALAALADDRSRCCIVTSHEPLGSAEDRAQRLDLDALLADGGYSR